MPDPPATLRKERSRRRKESRRAAKESQEKTSLVTKLEPLRLGDVVYLREEQEVVYLASDALGTDVSFRKGSSEQHAPADFLQCLWRVTPELEHAAARKSWSVSTRNPRRASSGSQLV